MADKSFGVKELNLIGASGTPTITSPNSVNINATNVAISTDITVGGMVSLGAGTSISSPGTNVLTFGTNSTEKVRITSGGSVGIGTDTPGAILEVFDATSNTIVNVKSGDSGAVLNLIDDSARSSIEQNGTTLKISSDTGAEDASSDIRLQVDGSTKMLIDDGGKVTITSGTNSGSAPSGGDNLVIKDSNGCGMSFLSGDGNSQNIYLGSTSDNDGVRLEGFYNSGSPFFSIHTAGSERLRIDANGILKTPNLNGNNHREIHRRITGFQGGSSVVNYLIVCETSRTNVRLAGRLFTARGSGTSATSAQLFDITFQTNHNASHRSGAIMGLHSGSEGYGHAEAEFVSLTYNSTNYYAIRFNGSAEGWVTDFDTCSFDGIREHTGTELFTQINTADHSITNVSVLTADTNKGDVTIQQADLRISDGDVIMANGHGISFAANSNASGMASELLDDYEEGTFTPTVTVEGQSAATTDKQYGRYIKVGNKVTVWCYVQLNGTPSGRGVNNAWQHGGLPFSQRNTAGGFDVGGPILYWTIDSTAALNGTAPYHLQARLFNNSTGGRIRGTDSSNNQTGQNLSLLLKDNTEYSYTFTYEVA